MESGLEMRLVRSFVVLAEELHYGRAAERLHITQPALSRQMRTLEAQVRCPLTVRGPHGVTLTEAGRQLYDEGERLLAHGYRTLDRTRRAGLGELGHLSVGFITAALDVVVDAVSQLRAQSSAVGFTLTERGYARQTAGLATGEDDVAFVRDATPADSWRLTELVSEESCLVVPATHRLAKYDKLTRRDLRKLTDEPFLSTLRWMTLRGVLPAAIDEIASTQATLRLVAAGAGISFMPSGYRSQAGSDVRFIPVTGYTTTLQLALPNRPLPPTTGRFVELVHQYYARG